MLPMVADKRENYSSFIYIVTHNDIYVLYFFLFFFCKRTKLPFIVVAWRVQREPWKDKTTHAYQQFGKHKVKGFCV